MPSRGNSPLTLELPAISDSEEISDAEFEAFRHLIRDVSGIALTGARRTLLVTRLARRLRATGCKTFSAYYEFVKGDASGKELYQLINSITTNKTEFFREAHHFRFLRMRIVDELRARVRRGGPRKLRIWSAGCSTGEEPYSIAMVLREALDGLVGWDVRILASDIDTDVLRRAALGVYPPEARAGVPENLREKSFSDVNLADGPHVRVSQDVRAIVTFRRINLIEQPWPIHTRFDAIFCRNVTIYFDRETQRLLYQRFARQLEPHGYFFAGHSENLGWLGPLFTSVGSTVYSIGAGAPAPAKRPSIAPARRDVALSPGEAHASRQPSVIRATLAASVAVCLFDPVARIGGMIQIHLVDSKRNPESASRAATQEMAKLVASINENGGERRRLRAKLFGAGKMAAIDSSRGSDRSAEETLRVVLGFLASEHVPVVAKRIGGEQSIEVQFDSNTARVLVREVTSRESRAAMDAEHAYRTALGESEVVPGGPKESG